MTSSCLRWCGGKTKLLPRILRYFPKDMPVYRELFVGGGAVFFALAERGRIDHAELMDANHQLMLMYARIKSYATGVSDALEQWRYAPVTEGLYLQVRKEYNDRTSDIDQTAAFIFLNKTCFNGVYRVNQKGGFNVPFGKISKPHLPSHTHLVEMQEVLQQTNAELSHGDAIQQLAYVGSGDYVYLDPPYDTVKDGFTGYASEWKGRESQRALAEAAKAAADRGVRLLLSNADTPFVRELYQGWKLEEVQVARSVNSSGSGRGKVGEFLISANLEAS